MDSLSLADIVQYHNDILASLALYFTESAPEFVERFAGYTRKQVISELASRTDETDIRSALILLANVEAAFRRDYQYRSRKKLKDALSKHFRDLYRKRQMSVRLNEDIFEAWKEHAPGSKRLIGDLKGAFNFRHWVAHGRYWERPRNRRYDFTYVYSLADDVHRSLPLQAGD